MNHYPHHIGDFNSATRHLTFVERALYRELLDLYYDTEQALISDVTRLARRVRANTEEQIAALKSVLDEFFVLTDEGWFNARCSDEIRSFQSKAEQQSRAGKASAAKRRAKRPVPKGGASAAAFTSVRDGGASDTGPTTVERPLNDRATNQNQNQNQNHERKETSSPKGGDGSVLLDGSVVPSMPAAWAAVFGDEFGVEIDGYDGMARKKFWPLADAWIKAGVTVGQMRSAIERARSEAKEPIAYLPAYVDRVLASVSAAAGHRAEQKFSDRQYGEGVMSL